MQLVLPPLYIVPWLSVIVDDVFYFPSDIEHDAIAYTTGIRDTLGDI